MIYKGKVRGGVVVLEPGIQLPEEMDVTIEPVAAESKPSYRQTYGGAVRNGVPIFPPAAGPPPTLELVNQLRDESP